MKTFVKSFLLLLLLAFPLSCEDMDDQPVPSNLQVNDFVWRGMNSYYLWQADVPDLADTKDDNEADYYSFLGSYDDPTAFFNHLRVPTTTDRFSVIFSDYTVLEGVLSGNTINNGMDYALKHKTGTTEVYGWVRYIIPGSDASTKDIQRGDIFYAIDGIPLNDDNYRSLFAQDTYTISLANYNNGAITPTGETVTLTKTNLSENPVLLHTVIQQGTHTIGYLMYNGFYSGYETALNNAFSNFVAQNVTDLVLDLRYNSGGAVTTATKLASMITGQFTGQVFAKLRWNAKAEAYYGVSQYTFAGGLNSLNLNKVYILTSNASASASELVINCLKPYINVVQIGDKTTGKNVASVTLYDSFDFTKSNVNPNHKYAMQPIVSKVVNKNDFGDYTAGITPDYELLEVMGNLGVLGDINEPLLSAAIAQIVANGKKMPTNSGIVPRDFINAKSMNPLGTEMYLDKK